MHITQCLHTSIHYIGILVSSNPIQKIAAATIWYSILLLLLFFVLFQVLCFQNFQFQTKGVIGQLAEAALVTLKIKPATSDDLENIAPYIDLCFAACEITRDLEAILCAADLEKLEDVSAYDVLKPTVVTESDVSVGKCVMMMMMMMMLG